MNTAIVRKPVLLTTLLLLSHLGSPALQANPDQLLFQAAPLPGNGDLESSLTLVDSRNTFNPAAIELDAGTSGLGTRNLSETVQTRTAIRQFHNSIAALQATAGPYAQDLAEQYLAAARLHQQLGEYEEALDLLGKAEHNQRVNFGLNATEQFLPIKLSIDIHLARQDYQQAVDRQEYLVHLHQSRFGRDAVAVVPQLAALGDMYFAAFERGIQRRPEGSGLALKMGPESAFVDPNKLTALDISFLWLHQAQRYYHRSIAALIDHQQFFDPLLLKLENSLIGTLFLQAKRQNIEYDPEFFTGARDPQLRDELRFDSNKGQGPGYRKGIEAFTRIITYLRHNPNVTPEQVAQSMLELGDWHLLFGRSKQAQAQYQATREWLLTQGLSNAAIAEVLTPAVPQQLPTFIARPHALPAEAQDPAWEGYLDVAFTLNPVGKVSDISVLDRSRNADAAVEDRLKKVLRNAPFRPVLVEPETLASKQLHSVRYYFAHR